MTVAQKIFNECKSALNNGSEILCAEIVVNYHNHSNEETIVPQNFKSMLKMGHNREDFERWLEELDVNYVEEIFNICDPYTQDISGTIWFNDGSWVVGYQDTHGYKRWDYNTQPEIPIELM